MPNPMVVKSEDALIKSLMKLARDESVIFESDSALDFSWLDNFANQFTWHYGIPIQVKELDNSWKRFEFKLI